MNMRWIQREALLFVILAQMAPAQGGSPGAVSGRVVGEDGRALRAIVAAQPAGAGGPTRVLTALDGTFTFAALPPGKYIICADVPVEQASLSNDPFLNGCPWNMPPATIQLAGGQTLAGVQVVVPKGVLVQVKIQDPEKLLPPDAAGNALASNSELDLLFRGADRHVQRPRLISQDGGSRTYAITVPYGAPLSLTAKSSQGKLNDDKGAPVQGDIPLQIAKGAHPTPIALTIHHN